MLQPVKNRVDHTGRRFLDVRRGQNGPGRIGFQPGAGGLTAQTAGRLAHILHVLDQVRVAAPIADQPPNRLLMVRGVMDNFGNAAAALPLPPSQIAMRRSQFLTTMRSTAS